MVRLKPDLQASWLRDESPPIDFATRIKSEYP